MEEKSYGPTILRLVVGATFIYTGILKLMEPAQTTGMLTNFGFPISVVMAWILIFSELLFGLAVLVGWKVKYTVWPLVLILVIAIILVSGPNITNSSGIVQVFMHLWGIAALISLALLGPGALSAGK